MREHTAPVPEERRNLVTIAPSMKHSIEHSIEHSKNSATIDETFDAALDGTFDGTLDDASVGTFGGAVRWNVATFDRTFQDDNDTRHNCITTPHSTEHSRTITI